MGHLSIGIVRKPSVIESGRFDYLVLKEAGVTRFIETENPAIGASFDYTAFKKTIVEFLELKTAEFAKTSFWKHSKRDPHATAYSFELSDLQIGEIESNLKSQESKWKTIEWLSETDLKGTWTPTQTFLFAQESKFSSPRFANEFRASLRNIAEARNRGKFVVFAGAGVSIESGLPGWSELVSELKKDISTTSQDYQEICEEYLVLRGEKEYYDRISRLLAHGTSRYNALHRKIAELSPVHIVTTNFDKHFEQIVEERALGYSIVRANSDLPFSKGNSLYVKMHGDIDVRNIVLTKSDYANYADNFRLIDSFIRESFASKIILFIGFSFTDPNLRKIIGSVKEILGNSHQRQYLFTPSGFTAGQSEELKKQGIEVLNYQISIQEYFDQIATADDLKSVEPLSQKGRKTYSFLRVLEEFDVVSDGLEDLEGEPQLIKSLQRFNELGAIPHDVLTSLIPFKLKRQPLYETTSHATFSYGSPVQLETLNEELLSLLKNHSEDGKVLYCNYQNAEHSLELQRFDATIKLIHNSGIFHIRRKNDTGRERYTFEPKNASVLCECARCLFDRMEFKKLVTLLETSSAVGICSGTAQDQGLSIAYGFYKTGQPLRAFSSLESVKNNSLRSQRYLTYFIACYNQNLLKNSLEYDHELDVNQAEVDGAIQKILSQDLYRILSVLPIDKELKQCLVYILEGGSIRRMASQVHSECEEIKRLFLDFKKGGFFATGPYHWYRVETRFFLIWNFYHKNFLFTDNSSDFFRSSQEYLEAMVASFMTSKNYQQKLKQLSKFFCAVFTLYGSPKQHLALLKKYKVKHLELASRKEVISEFTTLINSSYDRSEFFDAQISKSRSHQILASRSSLFGGSFRSTVNSWLVLFTHMELSAEEVNTILRQLIDYASVSDEHGGAGAFDYVMTFVHKNAKAIQLINQKALFALLLSDNLWPGSPLGKLTHSLIEAGVGSSVVDDALFSKFLGRLSPRRSWTFEVREAIEVYRLLNPVQREQFDNVLRAEIKNNSDFMTFRTIQRAYHTGIWDPVKNPEVFEPIVKSVLKDSLSFPKYQFFKNGRVESTSTTSWNNLYFIIWTIYENNLFGSETAKTLYENLKGDPLFQWILNPEHFDYSKFNITWLLIFSYDVFLVKLNGIPQFKKAVLDGLEKKYDAKVAEVYFG